MYPIFNEIHDYMFFSFEPLRNWWYLGEHDTKKNSFFSFFTFCALSTSNSLFYPKTILALFNLGSTLYRCLVFLIELNMETLGNIYFTHFSIFDLPRSIKLKWYLRTSPYILFQTHLSPLLLSDFWPYRQMVQRLKQTKTLANVKKTPDINCKTSCLIWSPLETRFVMNVVQSTLPHIFVLILTGAFSKKLLVSTILQWLSLPYCLFLGGYVREYYMLIFKIKWSLPQKILFLPQVYGATNSQIGYS